jgi:hypothetical protein
MAIDTRGIDAKISMDPVTAAQIAFEFTPGSVKLLKVVNRGHEYSPALSHLGNSIEPSAINIADLTTTYLHNKIREAEALFIQ